jgi:hypothetical protein
MAAPPAEVIYGGLVVAAYGAAISTFIAFRGVRRSRPTIKVVVRGFSPENPTDVDDHYVEVVAYNPRDRVVEVADVGLTVLPIAWFSEVSDPLNDGPITFPVRIGPGESKRFHFHWTVERTAHGWCEDALGRLHRGTPGGRWHRLELWLVGPMAPWRGGPLIGRLSRTVEPQSVDSLGVPYEDSASPR